MLNEFNTGGSHEQNPLGGIPQGMGSNGQMNTVEQGETRKGDFIYSDRIVLTPEVVLMSGLPKSFSGKTAAEASKIINRKFEGRNSKIDNSTKTNLLDRIAQAQEGIKAQEQAKISQSMQANSTEVPDMMNGQIPQGMEQFTNQNADGGFFDFEQNPDNANLISQGANILSDMIAPGGTYGKQQIKNEQAGYFDNKLAKDQMIEQGFSKLQDGVASAFGPVGLAVRGGQKFGKSIGDAIGGESGQAVSSVFDPISSAGSNLTNKDLSIGEKALGIIPGFSGAIAGRAGEKRLAQFEKEKRQREYYEKYIAPTENFDNVNVNAFGGTLGGPGDPETKPVYKPSEKAQRLFTTESEDFLPIRKIDKFTNPDGSYAYDYYYDRIPSDADYDANSHYHRYTAKEHAAKQSRQSGIQYSPRLMDYLKTTGGKLGRDLGQLAYGGKMNKYQDGGGLKPWELPQSTQADDPNRYRPLSTDPTTNVVMEYMNNPHKDPYADRLVNIDPNTIGNNEIIKSGQPYNTSKGSFNEKSPFSEKLKNMNGSFLRYAPVGMNMFQLATMGKPEVEKLDRLNNQYKKQYLDEATYENQARQQAAASINAIGRSGISGGQLTNAILGSQLNRTKAVSDAYNQIKQHNIAEEKIRQQVEMGNNQANIQQSNMEKDINARNRGAFKTERSKLLGQMGTDLGNIGKEEVYKKLAKEAFGYTWDGKYVVDSKGKKVTKDDGTPLSRKEMIMLKAEQN